MVVLAVEVCEVRRIEWKQATYLSAVSGPAWLVHSLQPRSGQVPGERIRH